MTDSKTLSVKVVGDIGSFQGDMNTAGQAVEGFGTKAEREIGRSTKAAKLSAESQKTLGKGLVVVGGSITALGVAAIKTGVSYNTLQQKTRAALTTLLGSAEAANAQMDKLDEFAKTSPFAKQVFIKAQQQLIGFGMAADKVLPTLDAIQNAVAAVGGSNQDIAEVANVLAKVQGTGKITARTLEELGIRGIDAATLIGDSMGKTGAQIRSSITAGSLDADKALTALTDGMQKKFGGAADNVKNTAAGAFDRVAAAWRDLSSDLAEPFVSKNGGGIFVDLLNGAADLMRLFQGLPGPLKTVTAGVVLLGGAAALAAGTFLLLQPRIAGAKVALVELNKWAIASGFSLKTLDKRLLLRNAAKGAALLGAVALASSDLGDKFKYADVAQYALMGAMLGPWGAAIGAGVGLMKVMSKSTRDAEASFQKMLKTAGDTSNLKEHNDMLEQLTAQSKLLKSSDGVKSFFKDQIDDIDKATSASREYQYSLQHLEDIIADGGDGINEMFDPQRMQDFADKIGPILEGAGLDIQEVLKVGPNSELWTEAVRAIDSYQQSTGTAAGRSEALTNALAATEDKMVSNADAAKGLQDALNDLWNPQMDLDAATIAWNESLRSLKGELTGGKHATDLSTEASEKNVTAIQGTIGALKEHIVAMAAAGKTSDEIRPQFERGRQAILNAGKAAGISKEAMNELLTEYKLTPELVETTVKEHGAADTKKAAQGVINKMQELNIFHATPSVSVKGLASAQASVRSIYSSLQSLNVFTARPHVSKPANPGAQADGGFYPNGIPAAANGLINDAHVARAGGGTRVIRYAEAETQGEAFIPFAQNKRKRSTEILSETAARFGYDLAPRGRELVTQGRAVSQAGSRGPLIGSLTVPAMKGEDARPVIREVMYQARKIERGGRWT